MGLFSVAQPSAQFHAHHSGCVWAACPAVSQGGDACTPYPPLFHCPGGSRRWNHGSASGEQHRRGSAWLRWVHGPAAMCCPAGVPFLSTKCWSCSHQKRCIAPSRCSPSVIGLLFPKSFSFCLAMMLLGYVLLYRAIAMQGKHISLRALCLPGAPALVL